jgi:FtsP/CotA-like multicopper oxidase with cupredoxin domain
MEVQIEAEVARLRLTADGAETEILRFAGSEPLRVIRLRKGQAGAFRIQNRLSEPMSLQWHGMRGRNGLDDPLTRQATSIPAGASQTVRFTPQDSGTSWFHPNPGTSDQTARGLRGVLIVDELDPPVVDEDVVVFLADWSLDHQNKIQFGSAAGAEPDSTVFTVAGFPAPREFVYPPRSRVRLRLINGSSQRVMLVACDGARPMIIAIDGQPSELFEPIRDTVPIGPGARFDYLVDLPATAGMNVRLTLKGTERVAGVLEPDRPLMLIRTAGEPKSPKPSFAPLTPNPALPPQIPLEASKRAELVIDGKTGGGAASALTWTVNGVSGVTLPKYPVLKVKQGDAVTLGFTNKSGLTVPLRVHGQAMRLLHTKDDGWEPYWRDSVLLPPASRQHVAFVADIPGQWLIESAFNHQNIAGLRCWFEVVRA